MRIVAVADTHLFHHELVVPDGDVFIHAGDMCRAGDLAELAEAARFVREQPHRHKIVVAGNHDWAFAEPDKRDKARALFGDDVHYLEDSGVTLDGVRFWGSPWQPEFNGWAFNLPRGQALFEKWALIPHDTHVVVTHGPPMGIGDRSSSTDKSERKGCQDLRERIFSIAPKLHLFGHIHEDGGVFSMNGITFANVTTWECERAPTVIDITFINEGALTITPFDVPPSHK